jgi:effector-binding domain-containing protein
MTRTTTIDAPQDMVFRTVNDLSTWESWSPWKEMDPNMKVTLGDPYVGKGGSYSWVGEASGSGKMEIRSSSGPDSLKTHVSFDGQGEADAFWRFEPTESGTKVSWGFHSDFPFPMNAMLLFMDFEGALQKDYDRGLELLKSYVEKKAMDTKQALEVKTVELPLRHFLAIREKASFANMTKVYEKNLPKVKQAVMDAGLKEAGMPCGLYYSWDESAQETDFAQAIPLMSAAEMDGFESVNLDPSSALLIEYYGSYDGLGAAHEAIEVYAQENGITLGTPAIEEYATDPGEEADPTKWLTRVYYPLTQ